MVVVVFFFFFFSIANLTLQGSVISPDGEERFQCSHSASVADTTAAWNVGKVVGDKLLETGAKQVLERVHQGKTS